MSGSAREAEPEVVLACQRGEREAFDVLVERYQREVYRLCYRYVNNHEDASDLAQEVFLKAWRAIERFRGESAFSTWLYRIAVNACLNFRALRRPKTSELDAELADPRPGAEWQVAREDDATRVRAAVSRLPDRQRLALTMFHYEGLSMQEVGGMLGVSADAVESLLARARRSLRADLALEWKSMQEEGRSDA